MESSKTEVAMTFWQKSLCTVSLMFLTAPVFAASPAARCLHRQPPNYPVMLRSMKIGGRVKLHLKVAADGKVVATTIIGGNPMLAELSCMAARNWTYERLEKSSEVEVELVFDPTVNEPQIQ
jgi:outer membrane biosynthesis protein TonB